MLESRHTPFIIAVTAAIVVAVLMGLLLVGLIGMEHWSERWPHLSLDTVVAYIRESGAWGVVVAIVLMVVHSFIPFPAELVAIANGLVYGPVWGTVITWVGAMAGALLAFGLSRKLGRPFVNKLLKHDKVRDVDNWLVNNGPGALMFSRFIPVIAFNLINYAAGLTRMSWWTFTWITGIGILPMTSLMVVMGHHIETLPWQAWLLLLMGGLVLWLITHRFTRRLRRNTVNTNKPARNGISS